MLCHINKDKVCHKKVLVLILVNSSTNNLVLDIHLFVSAVIQNFVSAQEELSKTDLLFRAMITYSPKSVVQ